jgi:hypothetical protein
LEGSGPPPPPPEPDAESLPPSGPPHCPRCGAEHEVDQEYCLECGHRLQPLGAPGPGGFRRELWSRDSPAWLWATLLALLLVALVAGAIAAVAATRDEDKKAGRPVVTRDRGTTETIGTITDTTPITLPTTQPTGTTETILPTGTTVTVPTFDQTTTQTAPTTTTPPPTSPSGSIRSWPAGKDGYTIVLASIETSRGRAPAERRANDAIDEGLPQVGILNSSDYLTLNPGYYVVFTGIYDTLSEARSALPTARSFQPLAYVREVTP